MFVAAEEVEDEQLWSIVGELSTLQDSDVCLFSVLQQRYRVFEREDINYCETRNFKYSIGFLSTLNRIQNIIDTEPKKTR